MSVRLTTEAELRNRCGDLITPQQRRRWKYCTTGQQRDPFDETPDAYDTFYRYGVTEADACADLHHRTNEEDQ